jgi:hypothetical protein
VLHTSVHVDASVAVTVTVPSVNSKRDGFGICEGSHTRLPATPGRLRNMGDIINGPGG